ncbi:MAG: phosphopantothenoylcysteine decarboxylase [Phycisphaeraceae bacterium]
MRLLITAGPTREPIDRVRYIGNRSSGSLGVALAAAGAAAGHQVTTLLGPVCPDLAAQARSAGRLYRFESSAELSQLMEAHFRDAETLIMAAAVADFRPATVAEGKLTRHTDPHHETTLKLMPTPDLVARAAATKRPGQRVVAFALEEPRHLEQRAAEKLRRKAVDAIIANPLGTMEADAITATWVPANGPTERLERLAKADFAAWLIAHIAIWAHQD